MAKVHFWLQVVVLALLAVVLADEALSRWGAPW